MRMLSCLPALLVACQADPACDEDAAPSLQLGTGEAGFEALPGGDVPELTLVHGPQGGYHLTIAFAATGLTASGVPLVAEEVEVQARATVDGVELATLGAFASFRCDGTTGTWTWWGTRLVFDAEPEDLAGKEAVITATIAGMDVSDTRTVRIVDPLVGIM